MLWYVFMIGRFDGFVYFVYWYLLDMSLLCKEKVFKGGEWIVE